MNNNSLIQIESFDKYDVVKSLEEISLINISLGDSFFNKKDFVKAVNYYLEEIDNLSELLIKNHSTNHIVSETSENFSDVNSKIKKLKSKVCSSYEKQGDELFEKKEWEKAISIYKKAIVFDNDSYLIFNKIAGCFKVSNKFEKAIQFFEKAIEIDKTSEESYKQIADIYFSRNNENEAIEFYEKYISLNETDYEIFNRLGLLYEKTGNLNQALNYFQKAINVRPDFQSAISNLFYASTKSMDFKHKEFDILVKTTLDSYLKSIDFTQDDLYSHPTYFKRGKKLHIGYLSADFSNNYVTDNLLTLFENYDREKHTVTCYSNNGVNNIAGKLNIFVDNFKNISHLSDKELANLIYNDNVDMLIELSGYAPNNRIFSLIYKPAPVQIIFSSNYFATSGIKEVDYFFIKNSQIKKEDAEYFSEEPYFLEDSNKYEKAKDIIFTSYIEKEYFDIWNKFSESHNSAIKELIFSIDSFSINDIPYLISISSFIEANLEINNISSAMEGMHHLIKIYKEIDVNDIDLLDIFMEELLYLRREYFNKLAENLTINEYNSELASFEKYMLNEVVSYELYNDLLFDFGKKLLGEGKPYDAKYYFDTFLDKITFEGKSGEENFNAYLEYCAKIGDLYFDSNNKSEAMIYYSGALELCNESELFTDKLAFLEILTELGFELKKYSECRVLTQNLLEISKKYNLADENTYSILGLAKSDYLKSNKSIDISDYLGSFIVDPTIQIYNYAIKKLNKRLKEINLEFQQVKLKFESIVKNKEIDKIEKIDKIDELKVIIFEILKCLNESSCINMSLYMLKTLSEEKNDLSNIFIKVVFYEEITDHKKSIDILESIINANFTENLKMFGFIKFYYAHLVEINGSNKNALSFYYDAYRKNKNIEYNLLFKFVYIYCKLSLWLTLADDKEINVFVYKIVIALNINESDINFIFSSLIEIINELLK